MSVIRQMSELVGGILTEWSTVGKKVKIGSYEPAPIEADVTDDLLREISSNRAFGDYAHVGKAWRDKVSSTISKTEKEVLSLVEKEPIDLAHWANALTFAVPASIRSKKTKHAALIKLLKKGKLRVVQIHDSGRDYGHDKEVHNYIRRLIVAPNHIT